MTAANQRCPSGRSARWRTTPSAAAAIKVVQVERLKKPEWIRVKAGSTNSRFYEIKQILRDAKLHTVCEEASCPNIG